MVTYGLVKGCVVNHFRDKLGIFLNYTILRPLGLGALRSPEERLAATRPFRGIDFELPVGTAFGGGPG